MLVRRRAAMPRQKISNAEYERQLAGQADPVGKLPPGFPSTHSRIPSTPSKFVVAKVGHLTEKDVVEPDAEEVAAREAIRTRTR
jgi:hypothetical protein